MIARKTTVMEPNQKPESSLKSEQTMFEKAIFDIQCQFGSQICKVFEKEEKSNFTSTGIKSLDEILGGGIPEGKIVEIFGNESCGKTSIALQTVSSYLKEGKRCVYIDLEHQLDAKYCKKFGVDISKLLLVEPNSAEECFQIIESLCKTGIIDLIIVDSVAAMHPESQFDPKDESDELVGQLARIMSKGLRITQSIANKTSIVFINKIIEKPVLFGNPETTFGGRALKFYSSIRLELRKTQLLKKGKEPIGMVITAKTVKNKLVPPLAKTNLNFYFEEGVSNV
ncbi:hypothetical protein FACS189459_6660 [Bacilli bacterium]|nr:hypothetical protein FACS189459_6660 [Bacilli bacterium]